MGRKGKRGADLTKGGAGEEKRDEQKMWTS